MTGLFITFEGGEGAGKSTQIKRLAEFLKLHGKDVVVTREPGGSPGAEAIRDIVLSGMVRQSGVETEALLMAAARSDHVKTVIKPALERGNIVLCDRYMDSTRAYQGADIADPQIVDFLEEIATHGIRPALTFILDIPAELGLERAQKRALHLSPANEGQGAAIPDRFEGDSIETHEKRRELFLEIAREDSDRCVVVNAQTCADDVFDCVREHIIERYSGIFRGDNV